MIPPMVSQLYSELEILFHVKTIPSEAELLYGLSCLQYIHPLEGLGHSAPTYIILIYRNRLDNEIQIVSMRN